MGDQTILVIGSDAHVEEGPDSERVKQCRASFKRCCSLQWLHHMREEGAVTQGFNGGCVHAGVVKADGFHGACALAARFEEGEQNIFVCDCEAIKCANASCILRDGILSNPASARILIEVIARIDGGV